MASQVLRDVVVRAGERAVVRQLSSQRAARRRCKRWVSPSCSASPARRRAAGCRSPAPPPSAPTRTGTRCRSRGRRASVLATTTPRARRRAIGGAAPRRPAPDHVRPLRTAQSSGRDRAGLRPRRQPPDVQARYNIAPMTDVPIVRVNAEGQRELVRMRWGLVPRWAKDPSIGARMINARGETIADKPSFQMPYRRHRCLLPADGFYEWQSHPPRGRRGRRCAQAADAHRDGRRLAVRARRALRALAQRGRQRARHLHDRDDGGQSRCSPRSTTGCR